MGKSLRDAVGWILIAGLIVAFSTFQPWVRVGARGLDAWQYHPAPAALAVTFGAILVAFGAIASFGIALRASCWVAIVVGALAALDCAGFAQTARTATVRTGYLSTGPVHLTWGPLLYGGGGLAAVVAGVVALALLQRGEAAA
jgi:hypothetical protein